MDHKGKHVKKGGKLGGIFSQISLVIDILTSGTGCIHKIRCFAEVLARQKIKMAWYGGKSERKLSGKRLTPSSPKMSQSRGVAHKKRGISEKSTSSLKITTFTSSQRVGGKTCRRAIRWGVILFGRSHET